MVRPRLRASLKCEPFFLLCLLSSEPVKESLRSLCIRLDEKSTTKRCLQENIASVEAMCYFCQVTFFFSIISPVLHLKSEPNQTHIIKPWSNFCEQLPAQMRPQSNSDEQGYTEKKKPRGAKLHLLVNYTQNKQIPVLRTYRPSCCCGSPCHVCQ